ncbi:MAG: DUF4160 domain-containing protein [Bacteroidia bacterium]
MPVIIVIQGFRFYFFSNENNEPPHIHVKKAGCVAKFWLLPDVKLSEVYGYKTQELRKAWQLVEENKELFIEKWNEYFNRF